MADDPLIDHLEETFRDGYRKEIDQEENIWRSLPFFVAALTLQLTGLGPVRTWMESGGAPPSRLTPWLLAVAGAATLAAILFLVLSVWPANFRYVAAEPLLRDYANQVRAQADAEASPERKDSRDIALAAVKALLVQQYAEAAQNNRRINLRRAAWRTRAGLAILASVLAILVLAAQPVLSDLHPHDPNQNPPGDCPGRARPAPHQPGRPATHDGGPQRLVPRDGTAGPAGAKP